MDDSCLHRLERETLKYMEIENIFYRLKHSESVQPIYALFKEIFEKEHQFTIQVSVILSPLGTDEHGP
jgi:hypothetical protein